MSAETVRVSESWLALREPADAAARSTQLVEELRRRLGATSLVIHDLGCGSGAMGRWLAPRLRGPQHWVLHDRDPDLLQRADANPPGPAADGSPVTAETNQSDIIRLSPNELAGATLITASALLDMLTRDELAQLVGLCVAAGCPALLTLSVVGRVQLTPADPMDDRVATAFNAHQRRVVARGRLLGPDAPSTAIEEFVRQGSEVLTRPSPWRLGAMENELAAEWFKGWLGAACEQQEGLRAEAGAYGRRRLAQAEAGELEVRVDHADLLVLPRPLTAPAGELPPRASPSG